MATDCLQTSSPKDDGEGGPLKRVVAAWMVSVARGAGNPRRSHNGPVSSLWSSDHVGSDAGGLWCMLTAPGAGGGQGSENGHVSQISP